VKRSTTTKTEAAIRRNRLRNLTGGFAYRKARNSKGHDGRLIREEEERTQRSLSAQSLAGRYEKRPKRKIEPRRGSVRVTGFLLDRLLANGGSKKVVRNAREEEEKRNSELTLGDHSTEGS